MGHAQRIDTHMDNGLALVVAVVLMAAVFVLDMFTPLGIAVWVGYLLPIWYLSRFSLNGAVLPSATLTCTALIVVGYLVVASGNLAHHRRGQSDDGRRPSLDHDHRPHPHTSGGRTCEGGARTSAGERSPVSGTHSCSSRCRLYHAMSVAASPSTTRLRWPCGGESRKSAKICGADRGRSTEPDGTPLPLDECPMAVTLREGRAIRGQEIVIERPDGTRRHVLPHPEPMRNAEGAVVGAINMLIDMTDRMKPSGPLHIWRRLSRLQTMRSSVRILQGVVTTWNGAAERLFGYTAQEMIGQPVSRAHSSGSAR